jgi:hypothetical protein
MNTRFGEALWPVLPQVQTFLVQVVMNPSSKKIERALCVRLDDEKHKQLTVSGTVVTEKATPVQPGI